MTKILLVDDEPLQRKVTRLHLEREGYLVETAAGADEAMQRARAAPPDLIVSDVLMGEIDGFGLCRRLHADRALDAIPIILVSSHYGHDDVEVAKAVGARALVERTPDFTAELAAVRACLAGRSSRRYSRISAQHYEEHLRANANQLSRLSERARRADERFRLLLDEASDVVAITTTDGVVLDANRRWHDLVGIEPNEMLGHQLHDLAEHGTGIDLAKALCAPIGDEAEVIAFQRRSDGATVYLQFTSRAVGLEGGEQILTIGRDVTAQIEATRKLVAAEEMYRSLVERIPDVVWRCNAEGVLSFISPNVSAVMGISAEALYRSGPGAWAGHVHPDDVVKVSAALESAMATGRPSETEFRFRSPDGRLLWLSSRVQRTQLGSELVLEGLTADITARRELEQSLAQAQKMEAIGQLIGGVAHDFNNLLAVILANSTFLLDQLADGDPRRDDAQEIAHAADRAAALTRQLLAFSRRQALELTDVDVNSITRNLEKMLRRLIGEDIAMTVDTAQDLGVVRADAGQLEQVIVNLVVNARDAMPRGGKLAISTSCVVLGADDASDLAPGPYARLSVRDNGSGMSTATRRRIFEPFFTTKERGYGTGLGLATCYGIVRQLGGRISIDSEVGAGTEFEVLLPLVARTEDEHAPRPTDTSRGTETVLIIEDDPAVRRGLAQILRRRGYHVLIAGDPAEAWTIVHNHKGAIQLVLSDVVLPDTSGPEILEKIRGVLPGIRTVLMSGYTDHHILRGALDRDGDFLQKPFTSDVLVRRVREVLDREQHDATG